MGMDRCGNMEGILEKYSRIYAAVDLDAIRYNMEQMKAGLTFGTKMYAVVKTDGYGHGAVPIAKELEPLDYICGFATATAQEALILKECGIAKNVLTLGYAFPCDYKDMVRRGIRATVFRPDTIEELAVCAGRLGRKAVVHIKVDTGMSRIGVRPDREGLALVKKALDTPELVLEGIFTHIARADERDKTSAKTQLAQFVRFVDHVEKETGYRIPVCHCSNSAGLMELREADMDAVRAGIALYGLWPSQEMDRSRISLHPAMEIKSRIVYVKEVEEGTQVSYGGTFTAHRPMRVATVPVGYGDGYPRGLSGKGRILVRGRKAPVIGRICMDQFMVDVTDIPNARQGDWVTLVGKEGEEEITME